MRLLSFIPIQVRRKRALIKDLVRKMRPLRRAEACLALFYPIMECTILVLISDRGIRRRDPSGAKVIKSFKQLTGILTIAALQPMMSHAMTTSKCDLIQIAASDVAKRYPFVNAAARHPIVVEKDTVWDVVFSLPPETLGFVPIISIDKRTCKIVSARMEQ